jgi:hypothetical protein
MEVQRREDDFVALRISLGSDFAKITQLCRTAHEVFRDFPNKPGKQNDRFPISGKRSFFAFGGHMPSLPVTAKRELYDKCIACRYLAQARFEQMSGQMPCLQGSDSDAKQRDCIYRCPACR